MPLELPRLLAAGYFIDTLFLFSSLIIRSISAVFSQFYTTLSFHQ